MKSHTLLNLNDEICTIELFSDSTNFHIIIVKSYHLFIASDDVSLSNNISSHTNEVNSHKEVK